MIERAVAFGAGGTLIGVLCEPAAEKVVASAPAVLMWNVGIQHRVGPYRIQVDLARDFARRGFTSMRFDLSGMGDSEARHGGPVDLPGALDDLHDAMSLLEKRRGTWSFVVIGFCSSVDSAHALALRDERVVGACFLEGYAYRTRGYWLHYPKRLLSRHRWKRYLARHLNGFGRRSAPNLGNPIHEERAAMGSVFARQYPTPERFATDVHRLQRRGARMLFIYVGGDSEFNHLGQFSEMIGTSALGDGIDIEYYSDADHTFFRATDRQRVVDRVGRWMSERFGERPVQAADKSAGNGPRKSVAVNPDGADGLDRAEASTTPRQGRGRAVT